MKNLLIPGLRHIFGGRYHKAKRRVWYLALILLGLVVGLELNAGAIPDSPGRWQPDGTQAVALEEGWVNDYITIQPRVGDHISSNLYVALFEGEHSWAALYLDRQKEALSRAAERSVPDPSALSGVRTLMQELDDYEHVLSLPADAH